MTHTTPFIPENLTTETFTALFSALQTQQLMKQDLVVPSELLKMQNGQLLYPGTDSVKLPDIPGVTHSGNAEPEAVQGLMMKRAQQNLAEWLGIPWKYYQVMNEEKHLSILDANVNYWLTADKKNLMLRTFHNGSQGTVRSILSDRYRIMDNLDVLMAFGQAVEASGLDMKVLRCDLTENGKMFMRVDFPSMTVDLAQYIKRDGSHDWLKNGNGSDPWFGGLILSNSETGDGAISVKPRLVREVCTNGAIIEAAVMRKYHLGRVRKDELNEGFYVSEKTRSLEVQMIQSRIMDIVKMLTDRDLFTSFLKNAAGSVTNVVVNQEPCVKNVTRQLQISDEQTDKILGLFMQRSMGTQYGIVDALTETARDTADPDQQCVLETQAAELMVMQPAEFTRKFDYIAQTQN